MRGGLIRFLTALLCILAALAVTLAISPDGTAGTYRYACYARRAIKAGSLIEAEADVGVMGYVGNDSASGYIPEKGGLSGRFAVKDILPGEPITMSNTAHVSEYGLGAEGGRAVSVSVRSLAAGVAGRLMPGDKVNVVCYSRGDGQARLFPELAGITVLGVCDDYGNELEAVAAGSSGMRNRGAAAVILLVDDYQALRLIEAENGGVLHFVFVGR
ncbi:MAG: RcpC/CpaB family pilus assembly protein [Oscillospiraceae bacterium]|nr:RcpC/CpaB family pilus assembly protein [Oscillospiraceae bacterium]